MSGPLNPTGMEQLMPGAFPSHPLQAHVTNGGQTPL